MTIFHPTNPKKVADHQLYEARRLLLEHEAAAEYHSAMTRMYRERIERLAPAGVTTEVGVDKRDASGPLL